MADRYAKLRGTLTSSMGKLSATLLENDRDGLYASVDLTEEQTRFIGAADPKTIRALLADYEEASARAFYETSVAQAAIEQVKVLEAERDRLREALLWNAAALNECCKECIREASNITIADETKSFSEILDMADAALEQEQP